LSEKTNKLAINCNKVMAQNKRVAIFFMVVVALIASFFLWLMMSQPEAPQTEVTKEIPHESLFTQ